MTSPPPAKTRFWPGLLVALAGAAGLACAACSEASGGGGAGADRGPAKVPVQKVTVAVARAEPLPEFIIAYGSLAPSERVDLAFLRSGRISALAVDLGSPVETNAVVARLDRGRLELELRAAEASVRQARVRLELKPAGADDTVEPESSALVRQARAVLAEATLTRDRVRDLVDKNLSSPSALDAAQAAFAVAESRLRQAVNEVRDRLAILAQRRVDLALAREHLREADLFAPFAGVIAERHVDVHSYIAAGQSVVTVLRVDPLRLRIQVPERDANRVNLGQAVYFAIDEHEIQLVGQIVRVSPEIRPDNRTLSVEAEVPNPEGRLRSGRFVRASIAVTAPRPGTTIPADCVITFAGVSRVFRLVDGKAVSQLVELGRTAAERVEITSGVAVGHTLVRSPEGLVDGQRVVTLAAAASVVDPVSPSAGDAQSKKGGASK